MAQTWWHTFEGGATLVAQPRTERHTGAITLRGPGATVLVSFEPQRGAASGSTTTPTRDAVGARDLVLLFVKHTKKTGRSKVHE